jgi:glutamine amidotransferase
MNSQGKIGVINHGVGNSIAVHNLIRKIGYNSIEIHDGSDLKAFNPSEDCLIIPGVGSFDAGIGALHDRGLFRVLNDFISNGGSVMGICLGMQMLFQGSEEGALVGLGHFEGRLSKLENRDNFPVPNVGWSEVVIDVPDEITKGINHPRFYHNHSFGFAGPHPSEIAHIEYSRRYSVILRKGNVVATQFHPEKSHGSGEAIFMNFLSQSK